MKAVNHILCSDLGGEADCTPYSPAQCICLPGCGPRLRPAFSVSLGIFFCAQAYLDDVNYYYSAHVNQESATDVDLVTDWDHLFWASNVLLAEATDEGAFHMATQVCPH